MQHVLFNDEATFHTCGHVNKHNCRICADEQPNELQEWERDSPKANADEQTNELQEWERDSPKANVWMGITK